MAHPAGAQIDVLLAQRQRGEIVQRRRVIETTNLHDVGAAFEAHDIPVLVDEGVPADMDPHRAHGRDLAWSAGAKSVRHDLARFEIGQIGW